MNKLMAKFCGVPTLQPKKRSATRYKIDWDTLGPKIRELAPTMNITKIADALGVCDKTVSRYMSENNISVLDGKNRNMGGNNPVWTKEEDEFLLANCDKSTAYVGKQLNRTSNAIRHRISALRAMGVDVSYSRHWSKHDEDIMRNNPTLSLSKLAELMPDRSLESIKKKRSRMKCRDVSRVSRKRR